MAQDTTIDGLLDRRVTLEQPAVGYRVAVDTVLLAAAVPVKSGQKALDLGCGIGGAMLCLACRAPEVAITGIEIDNQILMLAAANIARNEFTKHCDLRHTDATQLPDDLAGLFDHVFMNPPYHDEAKHDVSPRAQKKKANTDPGNLRLWIASAAKALKPGGMLTLIHRADRRDEILDHLQAKFGDVEILPILPKTGAPPHRIVLRTKKGATQRVTNCVNFVLHQGDGGFTEETENVLRHMKVLPFFESK